MDFLKHKLGQARGMVSSGTAGSAEPGPRQKGGGQPGGASAERSWHGGSGGW